MTRNELPWIALGAFGALTLYAAVIITIAGLVRGWKK